MRRIGVLMAINADDAEAQARIAAFVRGLQQLGWSVGKNVRIDYRFAGIDADTLRKYAAELVTLPPDVILAQSSPSIACVLAFWPWRFSPDVWFLPIAQGIEAA